MRHPSSTRQIVGNISIAIVCVVTTTSTMPIVSRNAQLSLNFVVVGGGKLWSVHAGCEYVLITLSHVLGISGLAVAYMLQKAGHRVRVVEKQGLHAPSAGLRIPPNLSKILRQWVGHDELRKVTMRCVGTPMHRCRYS